MIQAKMNATLLYMVNYNKEVLMATVQKNVTRIEQSQPEYAIRFYV